jgi:DNA polymerase III alpha subunit
MYLNGHSWFSLRYGTLSPRQLAQAAKERGIKCLALTDINNTSGVLEFWQACRDFGIKALIGVEFRREGRLLYVGLAKNREGFYQLNKLLTEASLDGKPLPHTPP